MTPKDRLDRAIREAELARSDYFDGKVGDADYILRILSLFTDVMGEVIAQEGQAAYVDLSERNLRDLLKEFEQHPRNASLVKYFHDGTFLRVRVEDDTEHYGDKTPGPGING